MAFERFSGAGRESRGRASRRAALRPVPVAMLSAALGSAHQVAAKSLREGLFLSTFAVSDLPKAMLGAALLSVPITFLVARLMTRFGPPRVTPWMFGLSALLSLGEWLLLPTAPRLTASVVYLHISLGGALLISAFWSVLNECFDPHALKHAVARIGASATLGGLLGGAAMERFAHFTDAHTALLLVASLALAAAASNGLLGSGASTAPVPKAAPVGEARVTSYLLTLGLLVACAAAASALGDIALKRAAARQLLGASACVRFFAAFYTGTSLVSFLLQVLVSRRLLGTLGIGGTLSVLPLSGVLLGAVSASAPSLLLIGALRGADLSLGPSLFRSAFEPLFTPVSEAARRKTKSLIDVVFDKAGDAFASLVVMAAALSGPRFLERGLLLLATGLSALTLLLALRAWRGYVAELEANLRAGALPLEGEPAAHASLRMTLSVSAFTQDASKLLPQLAKLRGAAADAHAREAAGTANDAPSLQLAPFVEDLPFDVRALVGSDERAIRATLTRQKLDPRLGAFIVPHLGSDVLATPALEALRRLGEGQAGLLADAMLSETQPLAVRRRIPHVLRTLHGAAVANALTRALECEVFDVRHRAALALLEVTANERALLPERRHVFALALADAERAKTASESIDHVFSLLALCFAREPLELARHALRGDDRKLRGIAFEYLESVLPDTVRAPLLQALKRGSESRAEPVRSEAELRAVLRRSIQSDVSPLSLAGEPD